MPLASHSVFRDYDFPPLHRLPSPQPGRQRLSFEQYDLLASRQTAAPGEKRDVRGVKRLSPFTVPSFLANLAAGHISIRYGFKGPIGTPVTACAASVQAIGDAARLIRTEEADVAICGGSEACIDLVSLGGFAAARALSTGFNETPARVPPL